MSKSRAAKRHRWRRACEIISEGRSQRAIVLDLSETGVFVQTGTRLPPGAQVEVRMLLADRGDAISVRARVARSKQVPPQLTSVARGGIGLKILDAPAAFYAAIAALDATEAPPQPGIATAPQTARTHFRVRVKQTDGPRSRSLEIVANAPDGACALALAQVGAGWEVVAAEPLE